MNTLFWSVVTNTVAPETTFRLTSRAITVSCALSVPLLLMVALSRNNTMSVTGTTTGPGGGVVVVPPGRVVGIGLGGSTTSRVVCLTMPLTVTWMTIVRKDLSDPADRVPVKIPDALVRLVVPLGVKMAFCPAATVTAAPATTLRFASTATTVNTAVSVPVLAMDGLSVSRAKSATDTGTGPGPAISATWTVVCLEIPLTVAVTVMSRLVRSEPRVRMPE